MWQSIDCYDIDPGGQATYHNSHKIVFFPSPKWVITVECEILTIKKTSLKTLQMGLYLVILNVSIKNMYIQEKEKEKINWM